MEANATGPDDGLKKEIAELRAKVVELEDKLSKLYVTDEEWKTFRKVVSVITGQAGLPEEAQDSGGIYVGRSCGPRGFYKVMPIGTAGPSGAVGSVIFCRVFEDFGR
jgi:hypothetical protein